MAVATRADSTPTISRRKVALGTAWAVPTILAAAAVPAYAVSCNDVGVSITSNCVRTGLLISTSPEFTIIPKDTTIPKGSVFTLTLSGAGFSSNLPLRGSLVDMSTVQGEARVGSTVTFTLKSDVTSGAKVLVNFSAIGTISEGLGVGLTMTITHWGGDDVQRCVPPVARAYESSHTYVVGNLALCTN